MMKKTLRIGIFGDNGVGKSSLIRRFCDNEFNEIPFSQTSTCRVFQLEHPKHGSITLNIRDEGNSTVSTSTISTVRGLDGAFIVYDPTQPSSSTAAHAWEEQFHHGADREVTLIYLANKADTRKSPLLDDEIRSSLEDKSRFFETSACDGMNVTLAFDRMVEILMERHQPPHHKSNRNREKHRSSGWIFKWFCI
jgi:GTPase SAR1 family protein